MELLAGFFLWIGDVAGIKWVRQETNPARKFFKAIAYVLAAFVVIVLAFVLLFG